MFSLRWSNQLWSLSYYHPLLPWSNKDLEMLSHSMWMLYGREKEKVYYCGSMGSCLYPQESWWGINLELVLAYDRLSIYLHSIYV